MCGGVEPQVAYLEHRRPLGRNRRTSARNRASNSAKENGFDEVIVGAGIESFDSVLDSIAGSQHQDG